MQCTLYVDLVAQWCAGAGWLVMADINSNLRAEHVWAVVQDGLIPATCCHQNKWSWFSIKTPAQDCPAINRSIAMWQHGNRSGGLVWHSTLTLSGSSDCYGCRMGQANSINTYRSYSILYYDNIITINYDTWAWSCNAESFTSHSDKAGRRKAASLLRITPGLCHAEPLQDLGNLERGWSESSPRTAVDSVIVSLPLFPCPQFRLCEDYTMSIAGPHFFSTGMLWSLWMRAILRRLSWALLFRGPLAIGTTPSRTKKISWSNQARAGFFVCFRVSVCSRGPRLSNTLTQTDWGCWRCVLLLASSQCITSTVGFGMYHARIKSRHTQRSSQIGRIDNLREIWDGPSAHFNVQSYRLFASAYSSMSEIWFTYIYIFLYIHICTEITIRWIRSVKQWLKLSVTLQTNSALWSFRPTRGLAPKLD